MAGVAHLKGPKINGVRENIYYATHKNCVEGLDEELSKKADSDTVTAALSAKANTADVNTALSKKLDSTATAVKAAKLETARSLKVSLSSSAAQTFDGSADATQIGVTGTLPVANGGTGKTNLSEVTVGKATQLETARNIQTNLGSTTAGSFNGTASVSAGVTGTLGIANGGTGQTTAAGVRNALGLGNTTGALPVANGGTGANAVAGARQNLFGDAMNTAAKAKYAITINDNWANGGYTTLQELRNFMGLGNTTSALPVANGGTGQTAIINNTTVGALGWDSSTGARAITSNTLAYWNGAYSGTSSNLSYYKGGAFGTIATCNSPLPIANGGTGKTNLNDVTVGAATKATQDGAGNSIVDTYVSKTTFEETIDNIRRWRKIPIYGYRIDKNEADPDTRVEYILDAAGMTPASYDSDTGQFNYGSWGDVWFVKDTKPLMLKYDGTVDYYLDKNDYTKKANGTASDVANIDYGGNAMAQIPLCWVYRYEDSNYYYEIVSPEKVDDNFKAYAHTDANGNIKPYFYLGIYLASSNSSKIRSLADQTVATNLNTATQFTQSTANGVGWHIQSWSQRILINSLLALMTKSFNAYQFFPDHKAFCMERFISSTAQRLAGFLNSYGNIYVKMTPEGTGYRSNDVSGYTFIRKLPHSGSTFKYVHTMSLNQYGFIPITLDASATTWFACRWSIENYHFCAPLSGIDLSSFYCNVNVNDTGWISTRLSYV